MSDLTDFLLQRIAEDEAAAVCADGPGCPNQDFEFSPGLTDCNQLNVGPNRWRAECESKRQIVEWHKSWPVLVQTPPTFDRIPSHDANNVAFRASQQMAWLTEQEYRERFGSEPPTGPVLRFLALPYADHPDYREEWKP